MTVGILFPHFQPTYTFMARELYSSIDGWDLVYDEQDARGRDAVDASGAHLGKVTDMVADTEAQRIVALVLEDGTEIDADRVELHADRVLVQGTTGASSYGSGSHLRVRTAHTGDDVGTMGSTGTGMTGSAMTGSAMSGGGTAGSGMSGGSSMAGSSGMDSGMDTTGRSGSGAHMSGTDSMGLGSTADVSTAQSISGTDAGYAAGAMGSALGSGSSMGSGSMGARRYEDHDSHFRSDFQRDYGSAGGRYEDVEPAYRYGHEIAGHESYRDRTWDDTLEGDLSRDYEGRYGVGTWDRVKMAVRSGFQHTRNAVTGGDDGARSTPY